MPLYLRHLNGLPCPRVWQDVLWQDAIHTFPPERLVLTLDAFQGVEGSWLTFADLPNSAPLRESLVVQERGEIRTPDIQSSGRGLALHLPGIAAEHISLSWEGSTVTQQVHAADHELLAGRNVLFAMILRPDPEQIAHWLNVNHAEQGAEAVLLIQRCVPGEDLTAWTEALNAILPEHITVVVARSQLMLGAPNSPAQTSHAFAPDGPGKGHRSYGVDPWRAPLSDMGLWHVAHHRFLARARAVLYCDVADLFPGDEGSVFDAAFESGTYLKFRGIRLYPWRLDDLEKPLHRHHSCYRFDGGPSENVWCVAPEGALKGAVWRPYRVSVKPPDAASERFRYFRCQALRTPGEPAAALAPKSGLQEHTDAVALLERHFEPIRDRAPRPLPAPPPGSLRNERILIVTTMKNEGPFILEWLAYHRAIGVTDFLVYTNDCTDGTDTLFDVLARKGIVRHLPNPFRDSGLKPQHAAYFDAQKQPEAALADWIIPMDVDEYITIHVGEGTLQDLFDAVPDANMISMTWRLFGNSDIGPYDEGFTTEQFTSSAPEFIRKPHQAWGFKTMFRPLGYYRKFGVHRPKGLRPEALHLINWVNGSGKLQPDFMLRTGWRSTVLNWGYELVTLNHYAVRSAESYLVKRDRGRVNHVDRDQGLSYWFRMNNNAEESTQIARMIPRQREEFDRLMADPEIAALHHACVAAHRTRIGELMQRPDYKALYDEITGVRLKALSKMHHCFGTATFLAGPDVVPQDFHLNADPGFFSPDGRAEDDADDDANAPGGG